MTVNPRLIFSAASTLRMVAASKAPSRFVRRWRSTERIWPRLIADGSVRPFPLLEATPTSTGYGLGDSFEVIAATMVTALYRFPMSF